MGKMPALVGAKVVCRACKLLRWPHLLPTLFEGFRCPPVIQANDGGLALMATNILTKNSRQP